MRILFCAIVLVLLIPGLIHSQSSVITTEERGVLIRCDDLGMCHAVNSAAIEVLETGIPVSFSVMAACPWFDEAVTILKRYPHASIGVHLTLNAEWKNYRWGPVSGASVVPSLVDSMGYFFPSRALLFAHKPELKEIELELRAQIERAIRSGLRIDYLDYHMGAAVQTSETRAIVEFLAKEYGLGISRYFGEVDAAGVYSAQPPFKLDTLLSRMEELPPGKITLLVFHIGLKTPEMNALEDLNVSGPRDMSTHREAELRALISPSMRQMLQRRGIKVFTYGDLLKTVGVKNMNRPIVKD